MQLQSIETKTTMTTYIFLDDIRIPPNDGNEWILVRDIDSAMRLLIEAWYCRNDDIVLSLDHDLGLDENGKDLPDGNDLVKKMEEMVATDPSFRPKLQLHVHSDNCVEIQQMLAGIRSIYRFLEQ